MRTAAHSARAVLPLIVVATASLVPGLGHTGAHTAAQPTEVIAVGQRRSASVQAEDARPIDRVARAAQAMPDQPYLRVVHAPEALPRLQPVTVAVLDAGIDARHPDLAGRIIGSHAFDTGDPLERNSPHGTATAGLIAAIDGNGIGIDGIALNASLLSVGVAAANPDVFDSRAIRSGIRWAADQANPYVPAPDCAYSGTTACYSTGGANDRPWGPSGTSYATAIVSGAAAILFGADPKLAPDQVAQLLRETARPVVADPQHQSGAGLLDLTAALARVQRGEIPAADLREPNDRPTDATP